MELFFALVLLAGTLGVPLFCLVSGGIALSRGRGGWGRIVVGALWLGLVAAARMPKMLAFRGPSGKPGAIPVTLMIQGFFETPAIFAMVFGMIALQMTN